MPPEELLPLFSSQSPPKAVAWFCFLVLLCVCNFLWQIHRLGMNFRTWSVFLLTEYVGRTSRLLMTCCFCSYFCDSLNFNNALLAPIGSHLSYV